jgi:hypothetical protein
MDIDTAMFTCRKGHDYTNIRDEELRDLTLLTNNFLRSYRQVQHQYNARYNKE